MNLKIRDKKLRSKFHKLISILQKYNSIIVAYSGGVDSSLLVFLCKNIDIKTLAITAVSEVYNYDDIPEIKRFVKENNIWHKIIYTNELSNKFFVRNNIDRCFFCKEELFRKLESIRNKYNIDVIMDGTNYDDIKFDNRPGYIAAKKYSIVSPYVEARIKKEDIRVLAKGLELKICDKLSSACLASRIVFGEKIDKEKLKKVYLAEKIIKKFWNKFFRVRVQNDVARIEVEKKEIMNFINEVEIEKLSSKIHELGFKFCVLDLDGYIPAGVREQKWRQ